MNISNGIWNAADTRISISFQYCSTTNFWSKRQTQKWMRNWKFILCNKCNKNNTHTHIKTATKVDWKESWRDAWAAGWKIKVLQQEKHLENGEKVFQFKKYKKKGNNNKTYICIYKLCSVVYVVILLVQPDITE